MSVWIVLSLILTVALLLLTPLTSTYQAARSSSTESVNQPEQVTAAPLPISGNLPLPAISSSHVFIVDQASKTVLLSINADEPVLPASTTKMMTALVALDYYHLSDTIVVSQAYPIGTHVGFEVGETLTVEQLLYALLVQSANDAAEILAQNYPGGRPAFISAMNTKANQIHLTHTHFTNPSGIDEEGHYSTAADLARLADVSLRKEAFAKIVGTENAVISRHVVTNVNQLLGKVDGVRGVKTGYTEGAGQALVTLVERNNHPVILVVLGSEDRFADTTILIEWVYSNFRWASLPADTPGQ